MEQVILLIWGVLFASLPLLAAAMLPRRSLAYKGSRSGSGATSCPWSVAACMGCSWLVEVCRLASATTAAGLFERVLKTPTAETTTTISTMPALKLTRGDKRKLKAAKRRAAHRAAAVAAAAAVSTPINAVSTPTITESASASGESLPAASASGTAPTTAATTPPAANAGTTTKAAPTAGAGTTTTTTTSETSAFNDVANGASASVSTCTDVADASAWVTVGSARRHRATTGTPPTTTIITTTATTSASPAHTAATPRGIPAPTRRLAHLPAGPVLAPVPRRAPLEPVEAATAKTTAPQPGVEFWAAYTTSPAAAVPPPTPSTADAAPVLSPLPTPRDEGAPLHRSTSTSTSSPALARTSSSSSSSCSSMVQAPSCRTSSSDGDSLASSGRGNTSSDSLASCSRATSCAGSPRASSTEDGRSQAATWSAPVAAPAPLGSTFETAVPHPPHPHCIVTLEFGACGMMDGSINLPAKEVCRVACCLPPRGAVWGDCCSYAIGRDARGQVAGVVLRHHTSTWGLWSPPEVLVRQLSAWGPEDQLLREDAARQDALPLGGLSSSAEVERALRIAFDMW